MTNNTEGLLPCDVALAFYEWLATIEREVRTHDLIPQEIAALCKALTRAAQPSTGLVERKLANAMECLALAEDVAGKLATRLAALEAALLSAPIPGRGEEMMAFRDRQDKWLRDVENPLLERPTDD